MVNTAHPPSSLIPGLALHKDGRASAEKDGVKYDWSIPAEIRDSLANSMRSNRK